MVVVITSRAAPPVSNPPYALFGGDDGEFTWRFGPVARMDNSPGHDGEVTQGYLDVWSGGDDGEVDGEDDDEDEKTSEEEQPVLATKLNA